MKKITLGLVAACLAACGAGPEVADGGETDAGFDAGIPDAGPPDAGPAPTDIPLQAASSFAVMADGGGGVQTGYELVVAFTLGDAGPDGGRILGLLDTGAAGLQLIGSELSPEALAQIALSGTSVLYEFPEANLQAEGTIGTATVGLGDRSAQIAVVVYDHFSCLPGTSCPTEGGLESYVFNGYVADFGVGMRNGSSGLGNPIVQLPGQPAFIVEAPGFGASTGTLRIGPTAQEVASYQTFELPTAAGTLPSPTGRRPGTIWASRPAWTS